MERPASRLRFTFASERPRTNLNVLLVAPTGRDAELIENALSLASAQSEVLKGVASSVEVFRTRDIGALLIAEEALGKEQIALLTSALANQPAWSALPVLVLTMGGKETFQSRRREQERLSLGDITLLERPIRVATLLSSVRAALHARSHQYERRVAEAVVRQSEKLALVGRLASSIAHEINNPLEAVTNLLYLLDGTTLSEEQHGYLDTAQRSWRESRKLLHKRLPSIASAIFKGKHPLLHYWIRFSCSIKDGWQGRKSW